MYNVSNQDNLGVLMPIYLGISCLASIAWSETVEAAEVMKAETLTRPWPSLPCRCPLLQEDHSQKSHHHGLGSGLAGKSLDQSHLLQWREKALG